MSVADIFLTLLGIGLIGFAFLFAWSMCMAAKADEDLREFITMNRLKRRRPAKFVHAVEKRKPSSRLPAGNF